MNDIIESPIAKVVEKPSTAAAPVAKSAYPTLLAHLDLDADNGAVLAAAGDLAERLGAGVIGVAARQPVEMMYGSAYLAGALIELDRTHFKDAMAAAEAEFRKALAHRAAWLQWRGDMAEGSLADYVARQARAADLIVTSPDVGVGFANNAVRTSVGDLVMSAGRPVLVVPNGDRGLDLDRVLVAWKDTRESRRAVADAIPLLSLAGEVTVVEVADPVDLDAARRRVEDVVQWLGRHGVKATSRAIETEHHDVVQLEELARHMKVGLVVAGAYGRARLLEWVFGGVTCDLLMHPPRCALLSH